MRRSRVYQAITARTRVHCFSPTLRDRARPSIWTKDKRLSAAGMAVPPGDVNPDGSGARWMPSSTSAWRGEPMTATDGGGGDDDDDKERGGWSGWSLVVVLVVAVASDGPVSLEVAIVGDDIPPSAVSYNPHGNDRYGINKKIVSTTSRHLDPAFPLFENSASVCQLPSSWSRFCWRLCVDHGTLAGAFKSQHCYWMGVIVYESIRNDRLGAFVPGA